MLQEMDIEFANKMQTEVYLQHCYQKCLRGGFTSYQKEKSPRLRVALMAIVRALKSRANLAILQHERFIRNYHSIGDSNDCRVHAKLRVQGEVIWTLRLLRLFRKGNPELSNSIKILGDILSGQQDSSRIANLVEEE